MAQTKSSRSAPFKRHAALLAALALVAGGAATAAVFGGWSDATRASAGQ
jgi:hypothetical protein